MSNMDSQSKGITWVGNLYQKLEAMYLDVEDMVCQETTKYVENRVQSVGGSVKKFYSELMEEFLPPSSEDPEKHKAGIREYPMDNPPPANELEKNDPLGKNLSCDSSVPPSLEVPEKPKEGIDENPVDNSPLAKELQIVAPDGENSSCGSSFRVSPNIMYLPPSLEAPEKSKEVIAENHMDESPLAKELDKGSDSAIEQNEDSTVLRRKLKFGVGETTVDDTLSCVEVVAPSGNDLSGRFLSTELQNENDRTCDVTTEMSTLTSVDVTQCSSMQGTGKICDELLDAADNVFYVPAAVFKNEAGIGPTPSGSIPLIKSNGTSDGYNVEEIAKGNGVASSDEATIGAYHCANLEESCVLVDIDELRVASQRAVKNKSYKKKIYDAFASRRRSQKKDVYEQIAVLSGEIDTGTSNEAGGSSRTSTLIRELDSKKLPVHDLCDSEWEIL